MKSLFETIHFELGQSLRATDFRGFGAPYSHHPEIELVYIIEGQGIRMIGQNVSLYESGDLVLLGPNLPHWWKPKKEGGDSDTERAMVIQCRAEWIEQASKTIQELKILATLLNKSRGGIHFPIQHHLELAQKVESLLKAPAKKQFIHWIDILYDCLESEYSEIICPHNQLNSLDLRIQKAIQYLQNHINQPISQTEVAKHIHLSPVHFSRLFKESVKMSFPEYCHQLRIPYIAQQLSDTHLNIAELAYENGYANLSNFNRVFKRIMGLSPLNYLKKTQ